MFASEIKLELWIPCREAANGLEAPLRDFPNKLARSRPLGVVLWKIASGTADYHEVMKGLCGYALWRSVVVGALVTMRNVRVG